MKKGNTRNNDAISRRDFLSATGAAAAAFTIVPRHVLGGPGYTAPSDMIHIAGIGVGGRGGSDIQGICTPDVPIERDRPQAPPPAQQSSGGQVPEGQARRQPEEKMPVKLANIYRLWHVA